MLSDEFDYILPPELIAQTPAAKREQAKMMALDRENNKILHHVFADIVDFLGKDDVLVLNNTKVLKARLLGKKSTGAAVEIFLLKPVSGNIWEALAKPSKRIKKNTVINIDKSLSVKVLELIDDGKWLVEFIYSDGGGDIYQAIERAGQMPLPPYIERKLSTDEIKKLDHERYQTVYAQKPGSVAAPTAGLHFTQDILDKLEQKGVEIAYVTLNVGLGTFKPVKCENIIEHKMDSENFEISAETATVINNAKKSGKNIVAVGTTTVRTLETVMAKYGDIKPVTDSSELFIYPGCEFKIVDKLITNFHLPKSTLIMLTSAFAGKELVFKAYEEAVKNRYRFYSYGDCMFVY